MRLVSALSFFLRSLKRNRKTDGTTLAMTTLMGSFTKGSKKFRNILLLPVLDNLVMGNRNNVRTFFTLVNIPIPTPLVVTKWHSLWGTASFPNRIREFFL